MVRLVRVVLIWVFVRGGDLFLGEVDLRGLGWCRRMVRFVVWRGGLVCIGEWEYFMWIGVFK